MSLHIRTLELGTTHCIERRVSYIHCLRDKKGYTDMPVKYSDDYIQEVAEGKRKAPTEYVKRLASAYKRGKLQKGETRENVSGHGKKRKKEREEHKKIEKQPEKQPEKHEEQQSVPIKYTDELLIQLTFNYIRDERSVSSYQKKLILQHRISVEMLQKTIGAAKIANSAMIDTYAYAYDERIIGHGKDKDGYYLIQIVSTRTGKRVYQWMKWDDISSVEEENILEISDRAITDVVIYYLVL